MTIQISEALPSDVNSIHQLIFELATYEKAPEEMVVTPEILLKDGFGDSKIFTCFVAKADDVVIFTNILMLFSILLGSIVNSRRTNSIKLNLTHESF